MSQSSDFEAIEARKREIDDEIERLQKEASELDVALRVLRRFSREGAGSSSKLGAPRPTGIPTLFEMTAEVVAQAEAAGKNGLTANEIVAEIERRYWPGLKGIQVLPSIYTFARNGRLGKSRDGRFNTVPKDEAPTG